MLKAHTWAPKIQVAGVSSLTEALFCARIGINAVGFTLDIPSGVHDGLTRPRAKEIIRNLPSSLTVVVITYLDRADELASLVEDVGGDALQLHGGISDTELDRFRRARPLTWIVGRVTVENELAIEQAARFSHDLYDAVILDSRDPVTRRIGATGLTHDWSISARIVACTQLPVILAGGLTSDNVADAIATVGPHGVDAHTGLENSDGTRNLLKIKRFAEAASRGFAERADRTNSL
ncbi:MAG: phosphoribosylanthranilate isomerase [Thermodesulfobacteriota bacterium]